MTRTEVFCDKCGVKIEADRTKLATECGPLRRERPEFDLCLGCARAFVAWTTEDRDEIDGQVDDAAGSV